MPISPPIPPPHVGIDGAKNPKSYLILQVGLNPVTHAKFGHMGHTGKAGWDLSNSGGPISRWLRKNSDICYTRENNQTSQEGDLEMGSKDETR